MKSLLLKIDKEKKAKESTEPHQTLYFSKTDKVVNDAQVFLYKNADFTPYEEKDEKQVSLDLD